MTAYGFAKVFRLQFVSLPSDLATPLAELTGQALVWGFFGRSDEYRLVIAVAEIGGGALLLFRRTTPLGALLLFGMLANILLIDILYGISGAIPLVLLLLGATSYILSVHWRAIRAALVPPVDPSRGGEPRSRSWARYGVRAAVFGAGLLLAYSARIQKMSQSTPIDGQWRVESVAARGVPTVMDSVATIYFEQAGRAVLRTASGFRRAKFGVAGKGRLSISEPHWPLRTLFEGRYQLQGSQLRLEDGRRTLLLSRVAR